MQVNTRFIVEVFPKYGGPVGNKLLNVYAYVGQGRLLPK
jgi:hypothetical protein